MTKRTTIFMIAGTALLLLAVGPAPRYIEELCIGGGYGTPDSGTDLDAAGNIAADGNLFIGGNTDADRSVSVTSGALATAALDLAAFDTGGAMWYDGANETLHIGSLDTGARNPLLTFPSDGSGATLAGTLHADGIDIGAEGVYLRGGEPLAVDDLAGGAETVRADHAATITANWDFSAAPLDDADVADTIAAGKLRGSGSLTDAVDLATAEVYGNLSATRITGQLGDDQVTNALTLGPSGNLSSPPPVGDLAPNSAVFTSLAAQTLSLGNGALSAPGDLSLTANAGAGALNLSAASANFSGNVLLASGKQLLHSGNALTTSDGRLRNSRLEYNGFLVLSATQGRPDASAACEGPVVLPFTGVNGAAFAFDAAANEAAFWCVAMPHCLPSSTNTFGLKLYWTATAGSAGDQVKWRVHSTSLADGSLFTQGFGAQANIVDAVQAQNALHIAAADTTPAFDIEPGELLVLRITRDAVAAEDTLASDAYLLGVKLEF